jgi:prolyl-tRNA synthetase
VEHWHDDKGIAWPVAVAPYQVHICTLNPDKAGVEAEGERLYAELQKRDIDVLLDDRATSAGVKFNDADLLGVPFRVTVSPRSLAAASVEVKRRDSTESVLLPIEGVVEELAKMVRESLAAQHCAKA